MAPTEQDAGGTEFHITVRTPDGRNFESIERHADAVAALHAATAAEKDSPCRIEVRPLVERTYAQGKSRWPHSLHVSASTDARLGWRQAEQDAGRREEHQRIVRIEVNRPADELTLALRGGQR